MKKTYNSPELELVSLDYTDIITSSAGDPFLGEDDDLSDLDISN